MTQPTAAMLVIGNEILSGRTVDKNINTIATAMTDVGIRLAEVRVVADIEAQIIDAVKALSSAYDYVFTSGGIGPTHDDITSETVAKAFGVPLEQNAEAYRRLKAHYDAAGKELNEARARMANIPVGAELIDNPVSAAPGFILENVHVMAGVPSIMNAMLDNIKAQLKGGDRIESETISSNLPEGDLAKRLGEIQEAYPMTDIGSYPFVRNGALGTSVVVRSDDVKAIASAVEQVKTHITSIGGTIFILGDA